MIKVKQIDVARLADVHEGTVSKILNNWPKDTFDDETKRRVFQAASRLGYLHPSVVKPQRRQASRKRFKAEVTVKTRLQNGSLFSEFQGKVANISSSGMLLKSLKGGKKGLPLKPYYFEITPTNTKLQFPKLKALHVRCTHDQRQIGLGVQFLNTLENEQINKLLKISHN